MAAFIPKRELLNVHFEGYKLSGNTLTKIRIKLPDPVKVAKLEEDEFSYQHVRAHTLHNHLQCDPLDLYSVYWCDNEGSVIKGTLSNDFLVTHKVFSHSTSKIELWANSSLLFLGNGMGLTCAGDNRIILFKKEVCLSTETSTSEQWIVLDTVTAGDFGAPVMIVTAVLGVTGSYVDILCAQFSSSSRNGAAPVPELGNNPIVYKWLRIDLRVSPSVMENIKAEDVLGHHIMCEIPSRSQTLYAAFQQESNTMNTELLFMSETTPGQTESSRLMMEETSENRSVCSGGGFNGGGGDDGDIFEEPDKHHGLGYKDDEGEVYQWSQTEEDIVISFHLEEDVTKKDVWCVIDRSEVSVGLSDGKTLLRGELAHNIDPEGSTWTIDQNILEVTLGKKVEGIEWKCVLRQKDKKLSTSLPLSESLKDLSKEELERAKDLLRGLSGDKAVPSEKRACSSTMQGMLEECDRSEEDVVMFVLSEQGQVQHRVSLGGHQLLFVAPSLGRGHPNIFSLRHDVDATVWLPHAAPTTLHSRWSHISTFSALGYVQASKRERKFTTCTPNLKIAVISDCTRHIFIYLQPDIKSKSAEEYIHTFLEPTRILGVAASDAGLVFVLTDVELNILKIPNYS